MEKLVIMKEDPYEGIKTLAWRVSRSEGFKLSFPKSMIMWNPRNRQLALPKWLFDKNQSYFSTLAQRGKCKVVS